MNKYIVYLMLEAFLFHICIFWIGVAFFTIIDWRREKKQTMSVLTLQKKNQIDWPLYYKCAKGTLMNQLITTLPASYLMGYIYESRGMYTEIDNVTLPYIIGQFGGMVVLEEILFYYLHRLFHQCQWLYQNIHKWHHTLVSPMAVGAIYAHPIENLVVNTLPVICVPAIVGLKYPYLFIWLSIATINTLMAHCGWNLSWIDAKFHDDHHLYRNRNYGVIGLCDWLHQTRGNPLSQKHGETP